MKARSLAACFPFSCPKRVLFGRRSGVPIRCRLTANPEEAPKVRAANRSYVFFRITGLSTEGEPVGAQGVPLTPGRSIAVDRLHEYGTPFFIETNLPIESGKRASPFHRLMIAQDTGSAIVGPARADLYWGAGDDAGRIAGRIRHRGRFVMLLPRELDMIEAGRHMPLPVPKPRILEHRSAATRSVLQRRRTFIESGRISTRSTRSWTTRACSAGKSSPHSGSSRSSASRTSASEISSPDCRAARQVRTTISGARSKPRS
jgi:3D (Asp-Asp-Asp) domain-containing protein